VIVEAVIASLIDAVMIATPVAPFAGFVELTVGAVVSVPGPVELSESHPAIAINITANGNAVRKPLRGFIRISSCYGSGGSRA